MQPIQRSCLAVVMMFVAVHAAADIGLPATGSVRDGRVEAELIADRTAIVAGRTALVGLRLMMDEGWHTYWKNPGDSGMATSIDWQLPEGFVAHNIDWPAPDYFEVSGLASYAYEGEIVLPVRIEVPADYSGERATLRATADWLVCKEQCEPGTAELSLTLPVVRDGETQVDPSTAELFAWAKRRNIMFPADDDHGAKATIEGDRLVLTLDAIYNPPFAAEWVDARFFPEDPMAIDMTAPQRFAFSADHGLKVSLARNAIASEPPQRLVGVLVWHNPKGLSGSPDSERFYQVNVDLRTVADEQ